MPDSHPEAMSSETYYKRWGIVPTQYMELVTDELKRLGLSAEEHINFLEILRRCLLMENATGYFDRDLSPKHANHFFPHNITYRKISITFRYDRSATIGGYTKRSRACDDLDTSKLMFTFIGRPYAFSGEHFVDALDVVSAVLDWVNTDAFLRGNTPGILIKEEMTHLQWIHHILLGDMFNMSLVSEYHPYGH